ncbi:MAG: hypothetical protein IT393_06855 [Nitrospirae bacterium]|nr:hypothetical protein [Nitrospirota bacterium]
MKIVMDSDCLVKLTKAGAKEDVINGMAVFIPALVKKETVDEAKKQGYEDAVIIEGNIDKKGLRVVKDQGKSIPAIPSSKGEKEVMSLYMEGGYDAIASDDRRFLKKLDALRIPYLTPAACILYLFKSGKVQKKKASKLLDALKPYISNEEYIIARFYVEEKS